jgi:predicted alpha/beta superfamily hydrolase
MRIWARIARWTLSLVAIATISCARAPTEPNDNIWRSLPGRVEPLSFPEFRESRPCWVYLPPGYETSGRRYPVLYVNDGELAFNAGVHANRIAESLIRRGEIEPVIMVAIETGGQRFFEYVPHPSYGGDAYLKAVRDTLKPEIDRRYRTLTDGINTGMTGFSLGGLISVHAGYAYDSTFGKVAGFSPSYGWVHYEYSAQARGRPPGLRRFYQDTGYPDDNGIGLMEQIAREQGFRLGVDFMSLTLPGGEHSFEAVQHRFPGMLRFLFPPKA